MACLLDELYVIESMNNYYVAMFCHSKDRVDMLNRVAQVLYATLQDALLDEITMRLARLVDRQRICGNDTFTLRRFDSFTSDAESPDVYKEKLDHAKYCIDVAFKETRNQYLAHLQLDSLRENTKYSYADTLKVREAIQGCMDFVEEAEKQFDIPRLYFPNHEEAKEVDKLVEVLEKGYGQIVPTKWWKRGDRDDDG